MLAKMVFNCDVSNQENTVHILMGFMLVMKLEAECPGNAQ
jgi:hypothetical protein